MGELIEPMPRCVGLMNALSSCCRAAATAAIIRSEPTVMRRSLARNGIGCSPSAREFFAGVFQEALEEMSVNQTGGR